MTEIPKVSVVIPAYNVSEFIVETLESAFSQTFKDFEVILVNDGSPDTVRFEELIKPYLGRIVYIKRPNGGVSVARNTAIENARGEIIAFLDGDDIWDREFLSSQLRFLESGGFDMVYCDAELFGMPSVEGRTFMQSAPSNGEVTVESLLDLRCHVITSGTIARKRSIEDAGMFETARVQSEDFHLWVRIAHRGFKIGYQRDVLTKYRVSPFGLSSNSINRVGRAIDVFERLDGAMKLNTRQRAILKRRISSFEADLKVEQGKAFLFERDFVAAAKAFRHAHQLRPSRKLALVSIASKIAPSLLLGIYKLAYPGEIAFIVNQNAPLDPEKNVTSLPQLHI